MLKKSRKPLARPKELEEEKYFEINSAKYDGREMSVIDFKDGTSLTIPQVEHLLHDSDFKSDEPLIGQRTGKKILKFLKEKNPTREEFIKHFTSVGLNKGGAMEKQMELFNMGGLPEMPPQTSDMSSGTFLFAEGGMPDDGGEKDPVSGNDVPAGSLAEEVRDDIPAMVSEGEFIFPADVVRFIGLNKLMELRQDAKMGLKKMEAMGQLGNPEDAELPDDIPFDMADIIVMDSDEETKE